MPDWKWSASSRKALSTCDRRLQRVARRALEISPIDFAVIEGHRGEARQKAMVAAGRSKLRWPGSKHNALPARAMDLVPWPVDWENALRFHILAGVVFAAAEIEAVSLRWGGDWDGDWSAADQAFHDLPHFELVEG